MSPIQPCDVLASQPMFGPFARRRAPQGDGWKLTRFGSLEQLGGKLVLQLVGILARLPLGIASRLLPFGVELPPHGIAGYEFLECFIRQDVANRNNSRRHARPPVSVRP